MYVSALKILFENWYDLLLSKLQYYQLQLKMYLSLLWLFATPLIGQNVVNFEKPIFAKTDAIQFYLNLKVRNCNFLIYFLLNQLPLKLNRRWS